MEILLKTFVLESANNFFGNIPKEVSDLINEIVVDPEIPKTDIFLCGALDANNVRIIQEFFSTMPDDWGVSFYELDNFPF